MKFIIGVVTFAAAQLQIRNLRLTGPDYNMLSGKVAVQIKDSEKDKITDTKFILGFVVLGISVIGSAAFVIRRMRKTVYNYLKSTDSILDGNF